MLELLIVVAALVAGPGGYRLARRPGKVRSLVGAGLLLAATALLGLEVLTGDALRVLSAAMAAFVLGSAAAWVVSLVKSPEPQDGAPPA